MNNNQLIYFYYLRSHQYKDKYAHPDKKWWDKLFK